MEDPVQLSSICFTAYAFDSKRLSIGAVPWSPFSQSPQDGIVDNLPKTREEGEQQASVNRSSSGFRSPLWITLAKFYGLRNGYRHARWDSSDYLYALVFLG
jgi:hypothetical protein